MIYLEVKINVDASQVGRVLCALRSLPLCFSRVQSWADVRAVRVR